MLSYIRLHLSRSFFRLTKLAKDKEKELKKDWINMVADAAADQLGIPWAICIQEIIAMCLLDFIFHHWYFDHGLVYVLNASLRSDV